MFSPLFNILHQGSSRSFILYMRGLISFLLQTQEPIYRLHRIQGLCHEIACPHSPVWVSIICGLFLFICLIIQSLGSALSYRVFFPMHNMRNSSSNPRRTVPRGVDSSEFISPIPIPYGGKGPHNFALKDIEPYVEGDTNRIDSPDYSFRFVVHGKNINMGDYQCGGFVCTTVPLCNIVSHLSVKDILNIARVHGISISSHVSKAVMVSIFDAHHCVTCNNAITIFSVVQSKRFRDRVRKQKPTPRPDSLLPFQTQKHKVVCPTEVEQPVNLSITSSTSTMPTFPPSPPHNELICDIARNFCFNSSPDKMEEAGCAICGQLTPSSKLTKLKC